LATDALTSQTGVLHSYVVSVEPDGTPVFDVDVLLRRLANEVYAAINEAGDIG